MPRRSARMDIMATILMPALLMVTMAHRGLMAASSSAPVPGSAAVTVMDTAEHLLAVDSTAEAAVDFMAAVVADSTVVVATVVADTGNCSSVDS